MIDLIFDCAILFGIILIYVKLRGRMDKLEQVMTAMYSDADRKSNAILNCQNSHYEAITDIKKMIMSDIVNKLDWSKINSDSGMTNYAIVSPGTVPLEELNVKDAKKKISTRTTKKKNNSK